MVHSTDPFVKELFPASSAKKETNSKKLALISVGSKFKVSMVVWVCMHGMHVSFCVCVSVRVCVHACVYVFMRVCTFVCAHVHMCVCMHACIYVFNECDHAYVHVLCVFSTANTLLLCIALHTYVPAYVL